MDTQPHDLTAALDRPIARRGVTSWRIGHAAAAELLQEVDKTHLGLAEPLAEIDQ